MEIGFTGSVKQPTTVQVQWLIDRMQELQPVVTRVHHGGARGSDLLMHRAARILNIPVTIHPRDKLTDEETAVIFAVDPGVTVLPGLPPLERDRNIVAASEALLALPRGPEHRRSGTWATIRYARKAGIPIAICYPDGRVELEGLIAA